MSRLKPYFPFLTWLPRYKREYLPGDFIAGAIIAAMVIPQGMAYAVLAGLPPIMGLYAGIVPTLIYGLLGTTGILTLGPTATSAVLVLVTVSPIAGDDPAKYMATAGALTLCMAFAFLILGFLKVGFIANLVSKPVTVAYVNASVLIIIFSQISNLTGIRIERTSRAHEIFQKLVDGIGEFSPITAVIGAISLAALIYMRGPLYNQLVRLKVNQTLAFTISRIGPLLVIAVSTLIVSIFRLDESAGVRILRDIPSGFPGLTFGPFDFQHLDTLLISAFIIASIEVIEAVAVARSMTTLSQKRQPIDPNQELIAMGAANIGGIFTGGMVTTTSVSRSAANFTAGGHTGLSSIIAAIFVFILVMFLTPLFYFLPQAALAAVVVYSVVYLLSLTDYSYFRRYSKGEPIPYIITFLGVMFIDIETGILGGVAASVAIQLYRTLRPPIVRLALIAHTTEYRDAVRFAANSQHIPDVLIMRIDESLYFANAQYLETFLRNKVAEYPDTKYLILACAPINTIDATATESLIDLIDEFKDLGVEIYFAELKERLLDRLERVQFPERVGRERFFSRIHDAVQATGRLHDETTLPI